MKNHQKGFTLIELVVVMVILGVLAATALPKFMNVNGQAHEAAVAATGGAYGTAIAMVKAQYIANGSTGADTDGVTGFGDGLIAANASGWPEEPLPGGTTLDNAGDCRDLWNALMQNPPTVATGSGSDYLATYATGSGAAEKCTYTYQTDTSKSIAYSPNTGDVVVTN